MSQNDIRITHRAFSNPKPRIIRAPSVPAVSMKKVMSNKTNRIHREPAVIIKPPVPQAPILPEAPVFNNEPEIIHNPLEVWRNKDDETDRVIVVFNTNGVVMLTDAAAFLEGQSAETWAMAEVSFIANYTQES